MDSFVCNLHLHVEFNFPLGWTCVKLALKCPSVKTQCLGGRLLFYLKFILRIKKKANNQLTCELPKWPLWYEVENRESWEKSVCTPNAPKFTQKQAQACCAHHTSETGLSGDAGSPKPLCSGSRRDIFATTFLPRKSDRLCFFGGVITNFKLLPWYLDIFGSFPHLSPVPPGAIQILAASGPWCTFLFYHHHHLFFSFCFLYFNSEDTTLGEIPVNEPVTQSI